MKLRYYNDRKGKIQSHEISTDLDIAKLSNYELCIGPKYGYTLTEALTNYYKAAVDLRDFLNQYIPKIKEGIELVDGFGNTITIWMMDCCHTGKSKEFLVKDTIDSFIKSITEEDSTMLTIDVRFINERYIEELVEIIKSEDRSIGVSGLELGMVKDHYDAILPSNISITDLDGERCYDRDSDTLYISGTPKSCPDPESINKENTLDKLIKSMDSLNTAELSFISGYIAATLWEREEGNKPKKEKE